MASTGDALDLVGLKYRVEQDSVPRMEVIGLSLDLREGVIRNMAKRTWRLYRALRRIVFQRHISGFALRAVIGHSCHFSMVQRPALAVLSAVWKFVESARDQVWMLPDEVVQELDAARGLLPALRHSISADIASTAYVTDSSLW